jgi:hypothetical protein
MKKNKKLHKLEIFELFVKHHGEKKFNQVNLLKHIDLKMDLLIFLAKYKLEHVLIENWNENINSHHVKHGIHHMKTLSMVI